MLAKCSLLRVGFLPEFPAGGHLFGRIGRARSASSKPLSSNCLAAGSGGLIGSRVQNLPLASWRLSRAKWKVQALMRHIAAVKDACKPRHSSSRSLLFPRQLCPRADLPVRQRCPHTFLLRYCRSSPASPSIPKRLTWRSELPAPESCPTSPCSQTPSPDSQSRQIRRHRCRRRSSPQPWAPAEMCPHEFSAFEATPLRPLRLVPAPHTRLQKSSGHSRCRSKPSLSDPHLRCNSRARWNPLQPRPNCAR